MPRLLFTRLVRQTYAIAPAFLPFLLFVFHPMWDLVQVRPESLTLLLFLDASWRIVGMSCYPVLGLYYLARRRPWLAASCLPLAIIFVILSL